jgi:peptidoglycan/LPS O-acetylase OafA/YrhL
VIWSHCYPLAGHSADWVFRCSGQIDAGSLAVDGFFILSGFLITQSWSSCARPGVFAAKRLLRIGPALIAALALGALIVGPINTSLPLRAYFASPETWGHFLGAALHRHLSLSTVFVGNPVANLVNSPLWSLRYEVLCYALVPAICRPGLRHSTSVVFAVFAGASLVALCSIHSRADALPSIGATLARLIGCFSAGMLYYLMRDRVPYSGRAVVFAALIIALALRYGGLTSVLPIAGGYLLLYAGFSPVVPLHDFGRHGDFSYGLYVFAYPIQQTIVRVIGPGLPVIVFFALSFLLTLPLAALSWHFIEAPALSLKPRAPGERAAARLRVALDGNLSAAVSVAGRPS